MPPDLFALVGDDDVEAVGRELEMRPAGRAERSAGQTLLHVAVSAPMVEVLINAGIEVDVAESESGCTPLHRAAHLRRVDVARALLDHGADVNHPGTMWGTPLNVMVALSGSPDHGGERTRELTALLLEAGAEVDAPGLYEGTALLSAARFGNLALVQQLVAAGADPRHRDQSGANALHHASRSPDVVAWLESWARDHGVAWAMDVTIEEAAQLSQRCLRVHPDGATMVTAAGAAAVAAWPIRSPTVPTWVIAGEEATLLDIAISPDGASLVLAWRDAGLEVRTWDHPTIATGFVGPRTAKGAIAFNPAGSMLAATESAETVRILRWPTGEILSEVDGGERTSSVAFSGTGHCLAVAKSYQGGAVIDVHNIDNHGHTALRFEIDRSRSGMNPLRDIDTVSHVKFTPDDTALVAWVTSATPGQTPPGWRGNLSCHSASDGTLNWETPIDIAVTHVGQSLPEIGAAMGYFTEFAFSPLGSSIALGIDGQLLELDSRNGSLIRRTPVNGHTHTVACSAQQERWLLAGTAGTTTAPIAAP